MAKTYDIAILGNTPAGNTAARKLADSGLDVIVIGSPAPVTEAPLQEWVPRDFFQIKGLSEDLRDRVGCDSFKRVRYINRSLEREVDYRFRKSAGCFLATDDLLKALAADAKDAGASSWNSTKPVDITLQEDGVEVSAARKVRARLLMVAQNRPNAVIADLGLAVRAMPHSPLVVAGIDIPLKSPKQAENLNDELNVIELNESSDMGMVFVRGRTLHVRVVSSSVASGHRGAELSNLVAHLQKAGRIPADLPLSRAKGAVWHPPSGEALDMETHVAKRCMLIGTAGGFSDMVTGQTLLPSVKSALLAADVAIKALKSDEPQTALMAFKDAWRKELADYLRPPTTSLRMMLPLLFANQQILSRFTRALLYGENL